MRPVLWSRAALDDLKVQLVFIARDNPAAARAVGQRIREAVAALGERPTGRAGRVIGTYEKSIARLPYIVSYTLRQMNGPESVVILRVIHAARDWPDNGWPSSDQADPSRRRP